MDGLLEDIGTSANDPENREKRMIVHVSGDFPDNFQSFKTPVIRDLVDLTSHAFDHRVISINRRSPGWAASAGVLIQRQALAIEERRFAYGTAIEYVAPGKGLRHRTVLEQLGEWIAQHCLLSGSKPDLLIGHKLTIEGIAVRKAASLLGVPYALSIQGNTDTKILKIRRDLTRDFAEIFHGARTVFPFAPWALRDVEQALGERSGPAYLLPCPTELDQAIPPNARGDGFISVFHLKNWRGKNLAGLVEAWKILARRGPPPPLEIIGGGTDEELAACRKLARDVPQITFAGPMDREQLAQRMNRASALVLPSLRESFGLVFIESLFAGTPIIYPQDTAIDGYFDGAAFAWRVKPRSAPSIAAAVEGVMANEASAKNALALWQKTPDARRFTRAKIAATFEHGLTEALGAA